MTDISTSDVSAEAAVDYTRLTDVAVLFQPGQVSAYFTVNILYDHAPEDRKTFVVSVKPNVNAAETGRTTVSIIDTDCEYYISFKGPIFLWV